MWPGKEVEERGGGGESGHSERRRRGGGEGCDDGDGAECVTV